MVQFNYITFKLPSLFSMQNLRWDFYLKLILGILIASLTRYYLYTNPFIINNDASIHLNGFGDVSSFSNFDETIPFSKLIQPYGFQFSMQILTEFFSIKEALILLDFSRIIVLFLMCIKLTKYLFNNTIIQIVAFITLFHLTITLGSSGIARSYSSIFIIWGLLNFTNENQSSNYWSWILCFFLSSVYYPITFLILLTMYGLQMISRIHKIKKELNFKTGLVLISVLFSITLLLKQGSIINKYEYGGKSIDKKFILKSNWVNSGGRVQLSRFYEEPFNSLYDEVESIFKRKMPISFFFKIHNVFTLILYFFIFVVVLILIYFYNNSNLKLILILLQAGLILYFLAIIFPFKLFIPNRYISHTFVIGLMLLFPMILDKILGDNKLFLYSSVFLYMFFFVYGKNYLIFENDYSEYKTLYTFVEKNTNPKSILISNDLEASNMIPYFSRRSVFLTKENMHAIYFEKYRTIQKRKLNEWNALFKSKDLKLFVKNLQKNHIDYLLLKNPFFSNHQLSVPKSLRINNANDTILKPLLFGIPFKVLSLKVKNENTEFRLYKTQDILIKNKAQ